MEIRVEMKPTAVTVYPDRARVTCNGRCEVKAGNHQLLLSQLPLALDPQSVRVTGSGSVGVQILSVDVKQEFFTDAPQKDIRQLEADIERLEDELRQLTDQKAGWEAHGRYLEGMRQATQAYAKGLAKGTAQIADQVEVIEFLQTQDTVMRTAVFELDKQARDIQKQIDKARQELGQIGKQKGRKLYQAVVDIQARGEGQFEPQISYVVNQASWRPLYDIRMNTNNGEKPMVELSTLAEIWQRTGQAWEDVALSVSTARPALNQRLPELHPWYIDELRPLPRHKMAVRAQPMAAPAAVRAMPEAEVMAEPAPVVEAEQLSASVEDSGTAVTFRVPGGTDVPHDGSPYKTTLANGRLDPKLDYVAVPKHTDAVFRRATVKNSGGAPLLAGQANLFVDEEYIGKTHLDYTAQDADLELLLGVEERITIEREIKRRDVDKKMLRDQRRIRFGYEIKVENLLDTAVDLSINDHIPVSRHDQIKVKLETAEPKPTEMSDLHELCWELTLGPRQKTAVSYEFTVEHPRGLQLTGLP